ncbi:MAG: N-acetylmuramoyl-L-alanine amidase [Steroidobacteraceae bacterium]|nr:N-acetylmuramoyl-L-alanine amidase [Steroidobacteraceae bacterium]
MKFGLRRILLALVLLAGGSSTLGVASPARAANQVRDVHLWSGGESTRLVLQFAEAPRYRFFTLDGPRRAVLDIEQARLAPGRSLPAPAGLARGLRAAPRPDGALRLVVELPEGTTARALPVDADERNPPRLILDLGPPGGSTAAAASPSSTAQAGEAGETGTPTPRVRAAHAPAPTGRPVIVAVDAGHGGQDPGAIGRGGTREKDVVLEIAREVAARIDREPGMRAVLTRQGDHFLTLRQRIKRARDAKADMFVSIHADSVVDRGVSGASVYVLSEKGASDEQARWLAERENAADLKGGVSLDDKDDMLASVLLDLSNSANIASSMQAAERVLRSIDRVGVVRKPRVQQAGFVVLKSPDIPSMLVETAYISNAADERMLRQSERRARLAEAIFRGVHDYFQDHPPEGTRFALARRAPSPTAQAASPARTLR